MELPGTCTREDRPDRAYGKESGRLSNGRPGPSIDRRLEVEGTVEFEDRLTDATASLSAYPGKRSL
jgi:hypothetical protein